ncbi:MAG: hypothetical protein AA908_08540 [Chlorobi bacterium NICIL-2]|nr:MAG: hypothetical protein AA908_08540 [Chlorobi bacterium NICIL-2]
MQRRETMREVRNSGHVEGTPTVRLLPRWRERTRERKMKRCSAGVFKDATAPPGACIQAPSYFRHTFRALSLQDAAPMQPA